MKPLFRRLLLSLLLLTAAALILLLSDLRSREGARSRAAPIQGRIPVAILKHSSNPMLEEVERGVLERLAADGYRDGGRIKLQRFSAEGDLPAANAIAKRITDGSFKMVITISTLSLQCVANANREGRVIHVFGSVTDPAGADVGIQKMNSTNKPPWMAGIGTFQPVGPIFRQAKQLWPDLKIVGVVWNPAERNSEACTIQARQACHELGMKLIEANVDQSKDVREAAESLVARGAQAFWTGADVTVVNAINALCDVAHRARIPVFSNRAGDVREGSLFDLGANYYEVGERVGDIAAAILDGANPATMVVSNFMPERLMLNRQVLKGLRDPWRFPDDLVARASLVIGEDGQVEKDVRKPAETPPDREAAPRPLAKQWRIQQVSYLESVMVEDAMRGFKDGLNEAGLQEGRDFTLRTLCAQGDMAALGSLFDLAQTAGVDLYVVYSTPTLQNALQRVRSTPIVFTVVADPFLAGAGKTDENHLPNVTGVYTLGPYREMAELLQKSFPNIKRVGTLFCPAEANSVANKDMFVREAARCGITVETVPANTAGELPDAALALCSRPIDAVVQVIDNLSLSGFPTIAHAAAQARLPLFACQGATVTQGAAVALTRDYYDAGSETAMKAARIMRGEDPAQIPFSPPRKVRILVNLKNAQAAHLIIPDALLRQAEQVPDKTSP